ncbi:hypothetical protein [Kitasatospora sp. NPDC007106]|uniref:hypothetical protein n=1 Tax=Kitasatospora sp. NPDC007106 TaxID=3156914 RepID=UPI00340A02EC
MTTTPIAVITIDDRPITFFLGLVEPGTQCGTCSAVSPGTDGDDRISIKLDGLGIICTDCAAAAAPGLDHIVHGLDHLVVGLLTARANDMPLHYEALSGQLINAIRGFAAAIGALPVD